MNNDNQELKICKCCGQEKSLSEFYFDNYHKCYRSSCKRCQIKKQIQWHKDWLKRLKKNKKPAIACGDCYYKGLLRGADEGGNIYYCRHLHIKIRDYTPAENCEDFIENESVYLNQMYD